jgi:short-subunit dehydrogenase
MNIRRLVSATLAVTAGLCVLQQPLAAQENAAVIKILQPDGTDPSTLKRILDGRRDSAKYRGRTFVIIGASSGFGKGLALRLAQHGANVVLAARRTNLLNELAAQVKSLGGEPLVVSTDVSNPENVEALLTATRQRFGNIDVWVNDTGVGAIGKFEDIPTADHARMIDVNFKGLVFGSHAALRQFRQQGYGTLINLGSIDSEVPLAYQASYSATKAAVLSLGRALNEELRLNKQRNIKVATIMPWAVDTPWWRHAANYSGGTPRMAAMDGPEKVVKAIVRTIDRPREEVPVGWKAVASNQFHRLMPDVVERISANIAHRRQIETAPPAPPTTGSLFEPMELGTGIDDSVRARIETENDLYKNRRRQLAD